MVYTNEDYEKEKQRWDAFEQAAMTKLLILSRVIKDPTITVYSLELGLDSQIDAFADPWDLLKLVMLGVELFDKVYENFGIKILNLWACEEYVIKPYESGRNTAKCVWWESAREAEYPKIPFHIWLLETLTATCETPEQQRALKNYSTLLKELRQKGLLEWPAPISD